MFPLPLVPSPPRAVDIVDIVVAVVVVAGGGEDDPPRVLRVHLAEAHAAAVAVAVVGDASFLRLQAI